MAYKAKFSDPNELFLLALERCECTISYDLHQRGEFGIYELGATGDKLCEGAKTASEVRNAIADKVNCHILNGIATDLGLGENANWNAICEGLKAREEIGAEYYFAAAVDKDMVEVLLWDDNWLDERVNLYKVCEKQGQKHELEDNLLLDEDKYINIADYMEQKECSLLPLDTGGYLVYNARTNTVDPLLPFLDDAELAFIEENIHITKNKNGTYHVEVDDNIPLDADLTEKLLLSGFRNFKEAIEECAIHTVDDLSEYVDLYEAQGNLAHAMMTKILYSHTAEGDALNDIAEKYDLDAYSYPTDWAKAARDIKKASPDIYQEHKATFSIATAYGSPRALPLEPVYNALKYRENLYDKAVKEQKKRENTFERG